MPKLLSASLPLALLIFANPIAAADYDPLAIDKPAETQTLELSVTDKSREREIPLKIYLPATEELAPVLLFSHGLGGNRDGSAYLGNHWSGRGYVVVCVQHPGSDDSVWRGKPLRDILPEMRRAASAENLILRVADIPAVLDQLETWNEEQGHELFGRLDLERVGMSGHSFGAMTTQAVSGQTLPMVRTRYTDPRIKAAIAFSPSSGRGDSERAFASVKVPWMLMTGTRDTSPIGGQTVASRRAVYPGLPRRIDKYELVLHDAEHSAFSDRPLPGDRLRRNPNHHRAILALSTAFWDAHLNGDETAREWLHGDAARGVLEEKDEWQLAVE